MFLDHLHGLVKSRYPFQMEKVIYCLDGAGYHKSREVRDYYQSEGIHVILLGPYSYLVSVQELVWAHLKTVNCNPEQIQTTKR